MLISSTEQYSMMQRHDDISAVLWSIVFECKVLWLHGALVTPLRGRSWAICTHRMSSVFRVKYCSFELEDRGHLVVERNSCNGDVLSKVLFLFFKAVGGLFI